MKPQELVLHLRRLLELLIVVEAKDIGRQAGFEEKAATLRGIKRTRV